jgi:NAD+ kinase
VSGAGAASSVGLVLHHHREEAAAVARQTCSALVEAGHGVELPEDDAALAGLEDRGVPEEWFGQGLDLVVSLGGDGTMLRTVGLVAGHDVPVLGVNFGQLGYLTETEPEHLLEVLDRVFAGEHRIEERMLLRIEVDDGHGGSGRSWVALNEAVLERTAAGHTVRLGVSLGGREFTTYAADGLIVATPTGSTAYSLSARGPIVDPDHRALLLTPVSPHMLFDRTLVLSPDEEIRLEVRGPRPATLSVDGQAVGDLVESDALVCRASSHSARLVTFGTRDFHEILKVKFGLADR